jgi:dipeptidyl-peptidase-3
LRSIFAGGCESLKEKALSKGITEDEWKHLLVYSAATLQNIGNYTSFGDNKFIPDITPDKFWTVITCSKAYEEHKEAITDIWENIKEVIYKTEAPFGTIRFREDGGLTTYYSANMTKKEAEIIKNFQEKEKIAPWNTRLLKRDEKSFCLTIASAEMGNLPYIKEHEWEGVKVEVRNGEFAPFMKKVVYHLSECLKYADNDNKKKMLENYVEHFKYGE